MNENIMLRKYSRDKGIVTRKIAEETILVPIRGRLADMRNIFMLNPVAEFIWDRLEKDRTLESILDDITGQFDIDKQIAKKDVLSFVRKLKDLELIGEAKKNDS